MFDEQRNHNPDGLVTEIEPSIQSRVVKDEADRLMFRELDNLAVSPEQGVRVDDYRDRIARLRNLLSFLGGLFFLKLVSDDAERRVFSVAVTGEPERDVFEVFEFGVELGYFHRSSIGNKDGTGRTRLYVLTRRLAPHFNLDPSSFSGYQFITNGVLRRAFIDPDTTLRDVKRRGVNAVSQDHQPELF